MAEDMLADAQPSMRQTGVRRTFSPAGMNVLLANAECRGPLPGNRHFPEMYLELYLLWTYLLLARAMHKMAAELCIFYLPNTAI